MRGVQHAATPRIAKQNTSEVQTQQMSAIAMHQKVALRVPRE